jgi:tRNA threonylcarbamoyladenosine biosynthesis protein TsaB
MSTPDPRLLIIETSGRSGQVALALGERLLQSRYLDETRRHARDLAPAVAELLRQQAWRPRDVQGVIVSIGPGSYTGLRVGIMSAKTFAYATGCALLGVDTFPAIALQVPVEVARVQVMADAQQEKIYVQQFARQQGGRGWVAESSLTIEPFADWLVCREKTAWISGPGLRAHENRLPAGSRVAPESAWDPQPQSLLHLGLARLRQGKADHFWALEPLYLRPSSAEEKWQARLHA